MKSKSIAIIAILMMAVGASAFASMDINPHTKNIKVGTTGHYTIHLNTDNTGSGSLQWSTNSANVNAGINGGSQSQFGTFNFVSTGHPQTFILDVTPQAGVILGQTYHIHVQYLDQSGDIDAVVTGDVVPTPELATGLLVTAGLIGLVGIVRFNRKK
jgi:hypothetical protein